MLLKAKAIGPSLQANIVVVLPNLCTIIVNGSFIPSFTLIISM